MTPKYAGPSIREIAEMLAERAESFCHDFLPGGQRSGPRWFCDGIMGGKGQHLSVVLTGVKQGRWKDFRADIGGDMIDLMAAVRGVDKSGALLEAKKWLGISSETGKHSRTRHSAARLAERTVKRDVAAEKEAHQHRLYVRELWAKRRSPQGTVVEAYIRARKITIEIPAAIALIPTLKHGPSGRWYPCMAAGIYSADQDDAGKPVMRMIGLHRTWLVVQELQDRDFIHDDHVMRLGLSATVDRLRFVPPGQSNDTGKMFTKGSLRGGFIPLTPSPTKQTLALCEGIETGLSVAQVHPGWSVWAALSVGNMAAIVIPPWVQHLILVADSDSGASRDANGVERTREDGSVIRPADDAINKAAKLHATVAADAGHKLHVEIAWPPTGMDVNDWLQAESLKTETVARVQGEKAETRAPARVQTESSAYADLHGPGL